MSLTEFDQEQYDRNRRREGFDEGELFGKQEDARNALALGLSIDQISQITGLSIEDIQALKATHAVMAEDGGAEYEPFGI